MEDRKAFDQGEAGPFGRRAPAAELMGPATALLVSILQRAFEAAVLPNQFEIDEQTPLSRLDALIEQVSAQLEQPAVVASATDRAFILGLVDQVAERVRVSIKRLPVDRAHRV